MSATPKRSAKSPQSELTPVAELFTRASLDTSRLRASDWRALDAYVRAASKPCRVKETIWEDARRTVGPLRQLVRTLVERKVQTGHKGLIVRMARAMQSARRPFWTWTDEFWQSTADNDIAQLTPQCRITVYVTAFLFCERLVWLDSPRMIPTVVISQTTFGAAAYDDAWETVRAKLNGLGYNANTDSNRTRHPASTSLALCTLIARTTDLSCLTVEVLEKARVLAHTEAIKFGVFSLSQALAELDYIPAPLSPRPATTRAAFESRMRSGVPSEYYALVDRYVETVALAPATKETARSILLRIGRWISATFPKGRSLDSWTPEVAAQLTAAINQSTVGEWKLAQSADGRDVRLANEGKPLKPRSKATFIRVFASFLKAIKRWGLVKLPRLDIEQDFAVPTSIVRLIGPDPRDIEEESWIKLVWASLNLTDEDVAGIRARYPIEFIRAAAVLWTHAGLRSDEHSRLRCGCCRDPTEDEIAKIREEDPDASVDACQLEVPASKTSPEFNKWVGGAVARLVRAWEAVRPRHRALLDKKTGALVHYLFMFRGRRISSGFINRTLIPLLSAKSGVPIERANGAMITSHSGRATAATWYYNTREGMTLEQLRVWLGHSQLKSTQNYVRVNPLTQLRSFARAQATSYSMTVLIDTDAVKSGAAARGENWQYHDLGHGFCGSLFWAKCPHRMVCPGCGYYTPNDSDVGKHLRAKNKAVQRLRLDMTLTDEERAALMGDITAHERLISKGMNVPTPTGETPAQLGRKPLPVLP